MSNAETTPEPIGTPQWLTIGEAAALLDQSAKTIRRRIKAGDLVAEMRHDPDIGGDRWYINAGQLPRQPGTAAALVPVEIVEKLEEAWRRAAEAEAKASSAETVAAFQTERREVAETERDAAREALQAEMARRWWKRRG